MPLKVSERQPRHAPELLADGTLVFRDRADFRPNLTPSEVLQVREAMRLHDSIASRCACARGGAAAVCAC